MLTVPCAVITELWCWTGHTMIWNKAYIFQLPPPPQLGETVLLTAPEGIAAKVMCATAWHWPSPSATLNCNATPCQRSLPCFLEPRSDQLGSLPLRCSSPDSFIMHLMPSPYVCDITSLDVQTKLRVEGHARGQENSQCSFLGTHCSLAATCFTRSQEVS